MRLMRILSADAFMHIEQQQLRKPTLRRRVVKGIGNDTGRVEALCPWQVVSRGAAILSIMLIPSLSSAAIYKCVAQDGGITYTDEPCPADTTTQYIDPAAPPWLNESSQTASTTPADSDAKSQSQPEIIASLCADDEFRVWLKAQRQSLPERDARTAKFIEISNLCRRALHLPDVAAPIPQTRPEAGSWAADAAAANTRADLVRIA